MGIGSTARASAAVFIPTLPREGPQQHTEDPELSKSIAQCGWSIAIGANAEVVHETPSFYKDLCERCFATLRGARKRRLLGSDGARGSELGICDPG